MNKTSHKLKTTSMRLLVPILFGFMTLMACQEQQRPKDKVAPADQKSTDEPISSADASKDQNKVILCFGNSLTAGYGLEEDQAYPSILQRRIDSLGWPYKVVNAGLSGETTADGQNRIDWVLRQPLDVFILELGANDMLRGLDLQQTQANLNTIINKVREKYPDISIILTGMQAPPNLGNDYTKQFANIFPKLAKNKKVKLVPFLLEGIAGDLSLNQADRIHPNQKGTEIMADNIWDVLRPILDQLNQSTD